MVELRGARTAPKAAWRVRKQQRRRCMLSRWVRWLVCIGEWKWSVSVGAKVGVKLSVRTGRKRTRQGRNDS